MGTRRLLRSHTKRERQESVYQEAQGFVPTVHIPTRLAVALRRMCGAAFEKKKKRKKVGVSFQDESWRLWGADNTQEEGGGSGWGNLTLSTTPPFPWHSSSSAPPDTHLRPHPYPHAHHHRLPLFSLPFVPPAG